MRRKTLWDRAFDYGQRWPMAYSWTMFTIRVQDAWLAGYRAAQRDARKRRAKR